MDPSKEKIVEATGLGAFFGVTVGSVESVWQIPRLGAQLPKFSHQLKHVGGRTALFAGVGALYSCGEYAAHSLRKEDDSLNAGFGAFLTGIVPALITRRPVVGVGVGTIAAIMMTAAVHMTKDKPTALEKYGVHRARQAEQ